MTTLIAGHHAGEFGHMLMTWQGIIRKMAERYDEVVMGCERQYRYLYEDFTDKFNSFHYEIKTRNMWMTNQRVYKLGDDYTDFHSSKIDHIYPSRELCLNPKTEQKFIKYGKFDENKKFDILIHARSTDNLNTGYRNWPIVKWEELVLRYNKTRDIASIGSKDGAHWIKGTHDLRGVPLNILADTMASSTLLLSPSSGPVLFGLLCGLKSIVWSDIPDRGLYNNRDRYLKMWNPFKTPCIFIPEWQPSVLSIAKEVDRCTL